jgi:hypothetical protein
VPQQPLVTSREGLGAFRPRRDRRRQPVGAVQLRHAPQLPQGVLQSLAEALVTLREADRAGLPVGVGQHEVVDQVLEHDPVDGHAQLGAVREVAGAEPAGVVDLGEEHFLGRALHGPPLLDPPLQRPQLPVGETPGEAALQIGEQGLGQQARVEHQLFFQLWPDLGEGVWPCAVIAVHASHLAGQLAEPAVLARGLGVQARLVRGPFLGDPLQIESSQPPDLLIREHPEPPVRVGSG